MTLCISFFALLCGETFTGFLSLSTNTRISNMFDNSILLLSLSYLLSCAPSYIEAQQKSWHSYKNVCTLYFYPYLHNAVLNLFSQRRTRNQKRRRRRRSNWNRRIIFLATVNNIKLEKISILQRSDIKLCLLLILESNLVFIVFFLFDLWCTSLFQS